MTQEEYDSYINQSATGHYVNDVFGAPKDPFSVGTVDALGQPVSATQATEAGAKWWEDFYGKGPNSVDLPTFQTANQDQARLQQQQVIQDLQRQAAGDPNSQAQQQLQQGYGAAQAQQASLGSTMRGQSAGAAMRGVQAGQQGIQRGLAGDQQMLQVQEQQAAQQMLAQMLAQQQGQDITQATGMAQGINQGNGLNQDMQNFYTQNGLQTSLAREQRGREARLGSMGVDQAYADLATQAANQATQAVAGITGTFATFGNDNRTGPQKIDDAFNGG